MRPREYFEQITIQEDSRYIFTLIPPGFEEQYNKYIKKPIENIKLEEGRIICESNLDIEVPMEGMNEIWKGIQRAGIVIADNTGFDKIVMLALGVALIKKKRVILIAEKTLDSKSNLPYDIRTLNVEFYESDKLDELSNSLVRLVEKMIDIERPKLLDARPVALMNRALRYRRDGDFDKALVLFKKMNEIEPNNWYIYKEWGITYMMIQNSKEANTKLNQALECAFMDREKCEIYIELAKLSQENNMENQAILYFEKAENLDNENAYLYEKWAYLYYRMGKFYEAMNKMMRAVKLAPNNRDYVWKFEYYTKKFADRDFRIDLKGFLENKREEAMTSYVTVNRSYETKDRGISTIDFEPYKELPKGPDIDEWEEGKDEVEEGWENVVKMYSQIVDIDDDQGLVWLNCKYKKGSAETFERAFPLKHFKNKKRLKVDQSIIIKVFEKPGEVRFFFEEAEEDFFDLDLEDISIDDLKDSPIFKPVKPNQ